MFATHKYNKSRDKSRLLLYFHAYTLIVCRYTLKVDYRITLTALFPCFLINKPFEGLTTFTPCRL